MLASSTFFEERTHPRPIVPSKYYRENWFSRFSSVRVRRNNEPSSSYCEIRRQNRKAFPY